MSTLLKLDLNSLTAPNNEITQKQTYKYINSYKGLSGKGTLSRKGLIVLIILNNFYNGSNPKKKIVIALPYSPVNTPERWYPAIQAG